MKFGIRSLFVGVTSIAVALFLLVAAPTLYAVPLLVFVHTALAAYFLIGLIYGDPPWRGFCLGAMIPAWATIIGLTWMLCAWFIASPWQTKDWGGLVEYVHGFAFTFRVWSTACWTLEIGVGAISWSAARRMSSRSAAD